MWSVERGECHHSPLGGFKALSSTKTCEVWGRKKEKAWKEGHSLSRCTCDVKTAFIAATHFDTSIYTCPAQVVWAGHISKRRAMGSHGISHHGPIMYQDANDGPYMAPTRTLCGGQGGELSSPGRDSDVFENRRF
mmetsp:Transcript_79150/g.128250  ORF Transcript_79150/g.128250 Transcript_79150/m.128250 type:complete len:135 (-) Transcript_79150:205-609(-)